MTTNCRVYNMFLHQLQAFFTPPTPRSVDLLISFLRNCNQPHSFAFVDSIRLAGHFSKEEEMHSVWLLTCASIVLLCIASISTADDKARRSLTVDAVWQDVLTRPSSSGLLRRVPEWSVEDVALWMNFTVGYPEYTPHILKHRVDGPTLLSLSAEDFDLYFPIEHGLHVIKLRAHLDILRGKCLCPGTQDNAGGDIEFWTLLRSENRRMWMLGGSSLQFPRVAMLVAYFFDYEGSVVPLMHGSDTESLTDTAKMFLSVSEEEVETAEAAVRSGVTAAASGPKRLTLAEEVIFWVSWLLVPDLFMAFHCGRLFVTNYVVIFFFVFHFLLQTYNELFLVHMYIKGEQIFDVAGLNVLQKFWHLHSWFTFVPIVFVVTGFVAPLLLQQLTVWALCGHATMVLVGIVIHVVTGGGGQTAGAAPSDEQKKE